MIAVILFRYSPLHNCLFETCHFSASNMNATCMYIRIYIYTVEPERDTIACLLQAKLTCACYRLCNLHTSTCSTGCRKTKTKILPAGVSLYSTSNLTYATAFKLRKRETELFASTKEIQNN